MPSNPDNSGQGMIKFRRGARVTSQYEKYVSLFREFSCDARVSGLLPRSARLASLPQLYSVSPMKIRNLVSVNNFPNSIESL